MKAGVFRRAPAFHGLYPKSKPPAMRVVLITGRMGRGGQLAVGKRVNGFAGFAGWWRSLLGTLLQRAILRAGRGGESYSQNSFVRPTRDCVPVFW